MSGSRLRVALVVGTACFAVACTGTPPNQVAEAPIIGESPGVGAEPADPSAVPGAEGGEAVTSPSDGTTVPATTAAPGSSTTGGTTTVGGSAGGSGTTGGTSTGGGQPGTSGGGTTGGQGTAGGDGGAEAQGPAEVALYDDEAKYTGITDDRVHFCGHAALIFAEAFDTRPEDLNVYWEVVNNAGGVHGRRVTASWVDDAYNPAQAVQAAEQCRSQDPFMLLGGIGFDQIPAVRNWAEQNRMLYFHHIAIAPDREYRYAYSAQPTVEAVGTAFGEHITKHHGKRPVGIIWRQSENWEPGHRLGLEYLDSQGVEVVADVPVQQNQGVYNQQIAELRSSGAEVVWVWENALGAAQIIQQAHSQNYRPKWVVFPFQATLDVTGSPDDPIEGVGTWSAYTPGGYGDDFSEFGYPEEIERFEAAYQQYRPRTRPNDILWQVWLGNKAMHDLLLKCGPDCNRNRFAGLLMSPYRATIAPNCAMDFGHPRSYGRHIGGHQFIVLESFRRSGGSGAYRTTRWCSEHLS